MCDLANQFDRLLDALPNHDPWPVLQDAGYLDMLAAADLGGAGLTLDDLLPLAVTMGRRTDGPPVIETILARRLSPGACDVADLEQFLLEREFDADFARAIGSLGAVGQMLGAMERLLEMTLDHARTRRQFGRAIGGFQAVQHQVAVMSEEIMAARMAAEIAYRGDLADLPVRRIAAAKVRVGQAAGIACATAHAVHGAIGISRDFALHRFTRRLNRWRRAHGGEAYWAQRLGEWALSAAGGFNDLTRAM